MRLKKIMYFWILGKSINQLSKNGEHYNEKEACEKRTTNILDIPGRKYAFDSTTILCDLPHLNRSTYEILQILSIFLTDKTHLRVLFDKTNFNDVKDQFSQIIPGLFD